MAISIVFSHMRFLVSSAQFVQVKPEYLCQSLIGDPKQDRVPCSNDDAFGKKASSNSWTSCKPSSHVKPSSCRSALHNQQHAVQK